MKKLKIRFSMGWLYLALTIGVVLLGLAHALGFIDLYLMFYPTPYN